MDRVSLTIEPGEYLSIMGPSGSGKSTLLNIIGLLDTPTSGTYLLDGEDVTRLPDHRLAAVRSRKIGFIFQFFHLIPRLTARQNIELPLLLAGVPGRERAERSSRLLESFGLASRQHHRPDELSGGQRQRVAIARAVINEPAVLLADEPTGNLDRAAGHEIIELMEQLNRSGLTLVLVTHDPDRQARRPPHPRGRRPYRRRRTRKGPWAVRAATPSASLSPAWPSAGCAPAHAARHEHRHVAAVSGAHRHRQRRRHYVVEPVQLARHRPGDRGPRPGRDRGQDAPPPWWARPRATSPWTMPARCAARRRPAARMAPFSLGRIAGVAYREPRTAGLPLLLHRRCSCPSTTWKWPAASCPRTWRSPGRYACSAPPSAASCSASRTRWARWVRLGRFRCQVMACSPPGPVAGSTPRNWWWCHVAFAQMLLNTPRGCSASWSRLATGVIPGSNQFILDTIAKPPLQRGGHHHRHPGLGAGHLRAHPRRTHPERGRDRRHQPDGGRHPHHERDAGAQHGEIGLCKAIGASLRRSWSAGHEAHSFPPWSAARPGDRPGRLPPGPKPHHHRSGGAESALLGHGRGPGHGARHRSSSSPCCPPGRRPGSIPSRPWPGAGPPWTPRRPGRFVTGSIRASGALACSPAWASPWASPR